MLVSKNYERGNKQKQKTKNKQKKTNKKAELDLVLADPNKKNRQAVVV